MEEEIIFKKGEETDLDTLMVNCGHGHKYFDDCNCNNGYNCHHPKNEEGDDYDCKNGCKGCFAYACPVAYQKDPDKDDEECNWGEDTTMVLTEDIMKHKIGR